MMLRVAVALLLPVVVNAAVIRGAVVEHTTGKPLARTNVAVMPIAGTPGDAMSKRTDRLGGFEFQNLSAGWYVVTFTRTGFAAHEYGQKQWNSAGHPIYLEQPAATFLQVRMNRFGAIAGTVLDEEEIGMPDHEVAIYRDTRPPQFLTRVKTDDRGMYRAGGLMPGSYLVRTVGKHYDEGDYLPTFHRESREVSDAQAVEVRLDEQTNNVNLKPHAGRLVTIAGEVTGGLGEPVITLVSDTGRIEQRGRSYRFDHMPPGRYEVYAQIESEGLAAYRDFSATSSPTLASVQLAGYSVNFQFFGGRPNEIQILARRKDLAGTSPPVRFPVGATSAPVTPGRWEFLALTPPDLFVSRVQSPRYNPNPRERADGWIEAYLPVYSAAIRYTLSDKPASISGVVTTTGREPVPGAPVFLEAWDPVDRRRVLDLHETRADDRGRYRFTGIAPGEYRILSTFDYRAPDSASMESSDAKSLKVVEAQSLQLDLDLFSIR